MVDKVENSKNGDWTNSTGAAATHYKQSSATLETSYLTSFSSIFTLALSADRPGPTVLSREQKIVAARLSGGGQGGWLPRVVMARRKSCERLIKTAQLAGGQRSNAHQKKSQVYFWRGFYLPINSATVGQLFRAFVKVQNNQKSQRIQQL